MRTQNRLRLLSPVVLFAGLALALTVVSKSPVQGEDEGQSQIQTNRQLQGQDEAEIRNMETGFQEAWNRHDAKAFANLCTEDGDVVNVVGWWWNGRSQIEKKISDAHAFIFRDSTLTHNEVHIKFLTPQIAVVHVRWSMVGHKNPDGTPGQPRKGIDTQVLQKQAGKWLIAAFHNTNCVPEVPFPTEPLKK